MTREDINLEQLAFRALSDPSRRDMIRLLSERPQSIAELCEGFDMTRTAVRKHIHVLEQGGIVSLTVQGRERRIQLVPEGLIAARAWLTRLPAEAFMCPLENQRATSHRPCSHEYGASLAG